MDIILFRKNAVFGRCNKNVAIRRCCKLTPVPGGTGWGSGLVVEKGQTQIKKLWDSTFYTVFTPFESEMQISTFEVNKRFVGC